jgi:hypothetical protein
MQKSIISHRLIVQSNSTKHKCNWPHNLSTYPSTKSDPAQFTGEHYCRAVVDIKWVGEPLVENQGIWYRVVRFEKGWGSQTAPEFQKREQKYQYDKLTGRE